MRENMGLFHGKRLDNGEWVEGHFFTQVYAPETIEEDWYCFIKPIGSETLESYRVDPDTVGECSGVPDKNGKRIFEGDIVKTHYANAKNSEFVEVVVFHNGRFCAEGNLGGTGRSWANLWDGIRHLPQDKCVYMDGVEVIGNIHDNTELMGGDE